MMQGIVKIMIPAIIAFVFSCIGLFIFGSALVRSLTRVAFFLRMSEFVAGFLIIALSTSIPELFVGVQSAIAGIPALSLGTVIGSNIADLTLIIGIAMILSKRIRVTGKTIKNEALLMVVIAALPLALMYAGAELSRLDGAILLAVFLWFGYHMIKQRASFRRSLSNHIGHTEAILATLTLIVSIAGIYLTSQSAVTYAQELSIEMQIPPILIGMVLLALGTGLPELAFETIAVRKGHPEMALGDIMGSVVANSTLVLGVTALIMPIKTDFFLFLVAGIFLIAIAIIFSSFVAARYLTWEVGIGFVMLYIFFLIVELEIKGIPVGRMLIGT